MAERFSYLSTNATKESLESVAFDRDGSGLGGVVFYTGEAFSHSTI